MQRLSALLHFSYLQRLLALLDGHGEGGEGEYTAHLLECDRAAAVDVQVELSTSDTRVWLWRREHEWEVAWG